jgi:hypothetical protein
MLETPNGWRKDWRRGAERRVTDADMGSSKLLMVRIVKRQGRWEGRSTQSRLFMSKPQGSLLEVSDWRKRATAESREQFVFTCQGAEFRRRAAE